MELDDIQKLYTKICTGYEKISIGSESCFLKHHTYSDRCLLKDKYKEGLSLAESNGIKKEEDYVQFYIEKNWWSKSKEDDIRTISAFIDNLKKSKEKLILPSQKDQVSKTIEEEESKLDSLLSEKRSIMPITAEEYANKYYNRYYLHYSLFRDEKFNVFFAETEDYFAEIEDSIYDNIWRDVYYNLDFLKLDNIKYAAASGFIQNLLILIGKEMSAMHFYGKPVVSLTINQIDLFSYASSFRRSINNATDTVPDYILSDPLALIDWCEGGGSSSSKAKSMLDRVPNKNKTRGERSGRISSIVGASSSDYKKLGIGGLAPANSDLISAAEQSGGKMLINQVIKKTDNIK